MTTLHVTNPFNVEASLNDWFKTAIAAITRPAWLPTAVEVRFNVPLTAPTPPAIGVYHFPVGQYVEYEGKYPGDRAVALMKVCAWVDKRTANWNAQLNTLVSMIQYVHASTAVVVIADYLTNPSAPTPQPYLVDIFDIEYKPTLDDPNPNYVQKQFDIRYQWHHQSS